MLYIMKRTQLYLDEALLKELKLRARQQGTTVSDLVRQAVRDKYQIHDPEQRRKVLLSLIGLWRDRTDLPDTETYVRSMRRSTRLDRLKP